MSWSPSRGKPFRSIDEEAVRGGMSSIAGELTFELRRLVNQVRDVSEVVYLVFDVRAELALDGFPVCVGTYDVEQRECESPIHCRDLLNGRRFLASHYNYPLGRIDLGGFNTAGDVKLVERVIIERFAEHWARLDDVPSRLQPYIGRTLEDEDCNPVPSVLLNLATGGIETLELFDR